MSIGLALIGTDGIVLATDSKLVINNDGQIEERNCQKLWIEDNSIGLMNASGDATLAESYRKHFYLHKATIINWETKSFEEKVKIFSAFVRDEFKLYGGNKSLAKKYDGYLLEFALVGYSGSSPKIAYMYSYDKRIPFYPRYSHYYYVLGIHNIAQYWITKFGLYNSDGMPTQNVNTLKNIAVMIINETSIHHKDSVGGKIQMAIIHPPDIPNNVEYPVDTESLIDTVKNETKNNSMEILQWLQNTGKTG